MRDRPAPAPSNGKTNIGRPPMGDGLSDRGAGPNYEEYADGVVTDPEPGSDPVTGLVPGGRRS